MNEAAVIIRSVQYFGVPLRASDKPASNLVADLGVVLVTRCHTSRLRAATQRLRHRHGVLHASGVWRRRHREGSAYLPG